MSQMIFDQKVGPSGFAISIDNIKNLNTIDTVAPLISVASGTAVPDMSKGNIIVVSITANAAITIGTPINMPVPFGVGATSTGLCWTLMIINNSGGALTTGPVLNASYRGAALTNPANTQAVTAQFIFNPAGDNKHTMVGTVSGSI